MGPCSETSDAHTEDSPALLSCISGCTILVTLDSVSEVLDIVISHPIAQSKPRVADPPGFAAHVVTFKKENLYYNNFAIPAGHMVPLSAETGSRLDGAFSNFLKELVTSGLDFGESPVPVWTKEKRVLNTSRLRSAHVTISYAIARCVANALIYGSKTIARYPVRQAVGLFDHRGHPARLISAFIQRSAAGLA